MELEKRIQGDGPGPVDVRAGIGRGGERREHGLGRDCLWGGGTRAAAACDGADLARPDLFGEQINTNTGGISFSQTDLSLPGNNALPVDVTRRLIVDGNKSPSFSTDVNLWRGYSFGEWELDLPYIGGTYSDTDHYGWDVRTSSPYARCSSPTTHDQFQPRDVEAA